MEPVTLRKIDSMGRVGIPKQVRDMFTLEEGDSMELYMNREQESILLKKFIPSMTCAVTGRNAMDNIRLAEGKLVISPDVAKLIGQELIKKGIIM